MKLLKYKYSDIGGPSWDFDEILLSNINLFVGDSGTGKTKFLNTIFNMGLVAVSPEVKTAGLWEVTFELNEVSYYWKIEIRKDDEGKVYINNEVLQEILSKKYIVERDKDQFFYDSNLLPKLSKSSSSISLLKDEPIIAPINMGFSSIMRRSFSVDHGTDPFQDRIITDDLIKRFETKKDLKFLHELESGNAGISTKLFFLSEYFPKTFEKLAQNFISVFSFIDKVEMKEVIGFPGKTALGKIMILCIQEKGSDVWIDIHQFSSGMQKVLMILTDTYIMPEGGIYIIDEYENSLGIGAIDFFPEFILTLDKKIQFILTSHHPYLINNIPVENWFIFHRKGTKVDIKFGEPLVKKYKGSRQDKFIQLINDSFYNTGIEA